MLSKIYLAYASALAILPHFAFAANSLPTVSVESICRDAPEAALSESKAAAYQNCLHEEIAARDQLRQNWARYPAHARATCAEPPGVQISYVELQTCFDMQSGGSVSKPPKPGGAPIAARAQARPKAMTAGARAVDGEMSLTADMASESTTKPRPKRIRIFARPPSCRCRDLLGPPDHP